MTHELRGLKHTSQSPLTRRLLQSAETDASAPGAMQRALSGLGLASAGIVAAKVAAAGTQSGARALAGAAVAGKTGLLSLAVWVSVGFIGSVTLVGGASLLSHDAEHPRTATASSALASMSGPTRTPSQAQSAAAPGVTAPGVAASQSPEAPLGPESSKPPPLDPKVAERLAHLALGAPRDSEEPPAPTMSLPSAAAFDGPGPVATTSSNNPNQLVELARLASIRKALAAMHPAAALTQLDQFAKRYPSSPLGEEALVLRIEALDAAGRSLEAITLAQEFIERHRTSVYMNRVRVLERDAGEHWQRDRNRNGVH